MAYQTLYRKWRPSTFDEVVGQGHITSTLKNEIINGKTAHAYMFTGTRGTGKTSTAKILSRAINCENPKNGNPCNECSSCLGIINETILDVVEMDAASNTGVDSIREIIDQVRYSTAGTKYKVYIIDEVHMLSIGAFNALLKTLEEPPAHVVFILATTEIHKVPATILSRCQRFDFKNIGTMDIAGAVGDILKKENVAITDEAVEYIAYLGNGSMRDALSITEQCLAYKATDIDYSDVTEILGTLDDKFLYNTAGFIAGSDVKGVLTLYNECIANGKNPSLFAEGLLKTLRDILMYKLAPEITDFGSGKIPMISHAAKLFTHERLTRSIDVLNSGLRDLKQFNNASVVVETMLIKLTSPEYDMDITSLLDRISVLEKKIAELASGAVVAPAWVPVSDKTEKIPETPAIKAEVPATEDIPKPIMKKSDSKLQDIVTAWDDVIRELESSGKLMTFVSLYGVKPRCDGDTLILPFESRDSASNFSNSNAVSDVAGVITKLFGLNADIKCVFEEKSVQNSSQNDDIFTQIAEISNNYPENFKID